MTSFLEAMNSLFWTSSSPGLSVISKVPRAWLFLHYKRRKALQGSWQQRALFEANRSNFSDDRAAKWCLTVGMKISARISDVSCAASFGITSESQTKRKTLATYPVGAGLCPTLRFSQETGRRRFPWWRTARSMVENARKLRLKPFEYMNFSFALASPGTQERICG